MQKCVIYWSPPLNLFYEYYEKRKKYTVFGCLIGGGEHWQDKLKLYDQGGEQCHKYEKYVEGNDMF